MKLNIQKLLFPISALHILTNIMEDKSRSQYICKLKVKKFQISNFEFIV